MMDFLGRKLYLWKYRFSKYTGILTSKAINLLPVMPIWKAAIVERIPIRTKFNYSEGDIFTKLRSFSEAKRLLNGEPETTKWLMDYFKTGDVFYDIGANVGFFSLVGRKIVGKELQNLFI